MVLKKLFGSMSVLKIKKFLLQDLRKHGEVGFFLAKFIRKIHERQLLRGGIKAAIDRKFVEVFGHTVDWESPKTLNEKIQWLKVYGYEPFHTICADKYRMREYLYEKFGNNDYQIPVLFVTDKWKDITLDIIPNEPCVIKANHTQGDVVIVRDKTCLDIKTLRKDCRWWLVRNLYPECYEPQYKDIKPLIMIEKLLLTKDGYVPNDYKLHYINGELQFVYCSVSRETINKRNIYDANWQPLMFTWSEKYKDTSTLRGPEIPAPPTFDKMKELGAEIAKDFKYVRVDFYDVDGELYFGEITLHHGSGLDVFSPEFYDSVYGELLKL